jgi:O-antigen/teichoic acid export membrane protein
MFRNVILIFSGNIFSSIMGLVRNLIIARLLTVEHFGIASTFAISMSIVEMLTTLGLHQLIIQDNNGDDPKLQAGLQGFHLLRGAFSSSLLFLLAKPIASFMGTEDIAWAYQLLAFIPVLNGLVHFDIYRLQRQLNYIPSILCSTVPALLSVLLIWPLYMIFEDYRVMLGIILAQALATMIVSHLFSQRRYHVILNKDIITHAVRFGWPLLINSILIFFVFQGEKIIVGREIGLEALAIFSMGFTLTLWPAMLLANSIQSIFLPLLSESKDTKPEFQSIAMVTLQAHFALGALFVTGGVLLGPTLVSYLLGEKYAPLVALFPWLVVLQAMRLMEGGSSIIALAAGRTGVSAVANLVRISVMPFSWYVASTTGDLHLIIWFAIGSELTGLMVSLFMMRRQVNISVAPSVWPFTLVMSLSALTVLYASVFENMHSAYTLRAWTAIAMLGLVITALTMMTELRRYIWTPKDGLQQTD